MQSLPCLAALLQVGDLHRAVQLAASDPGSDLAPSHADFADRVKQLVEQLHQVQAQKDADAAHALREAQQQHSLMRGRMQALHDGYRRLRHRVEDQVGLHLGLDTWRTADLLLRDGCSTVCRVMCLAPVASFGRMASTQLGGTRGTAG